MREIIPLILGNFWMTSSDTLKNFEISGTLKNFRCGVSCVESNALIASLVFITISGT